MNETVKIRCIAIDDEEAAIEVLHHFISRIPYLSYMGGYTSPLAALEAIREQKPDLIFTDIQMPEINGLDLVKHINADCKIILTTAYSQYALEGYDLDVADYLLKPVAFPRFLAAVEKVKRSLSQNPVPHSQAASIDNDFILVKGELKGKLIKINLVDIDYIEGLKNYVAIHYDHKKIVSLLNLKDLEEKLPAERFIRVHKSFIVPFSKIDAIENNRITIKNLPAASVLIGETYKAAFMIKMKRNIFE